MPIELTYMYRDASNYKQYRSVLLDGELTPQQIADIENTLEVEDEEQRFFIPSQVGLQDLQLAFNGYQNEDDHVWHTYLGFETIEPDKRLPEMSAQHLYENFMQCEGWDIDRALDALNANCLGFIGETHFENDEGKIVPIEVGVTHRRTRQGTMIRIEQD